MRVGWDSPEPQEEIYLIASRFSAVRKADGQNGRPGLPAKAGQRRWPRNTSMPPSVYRDVRQLIGPYPYKKFALVENFWETGFGMPSFTLLGPTVLRLPFIINTSYPHEILHNWWGNSVYPDYEKGNWSEGLTAYLADHLLKEQQGGGAEYRLNTLQKYADYVLSGRDFPLTQFTSRHSPSTEAVGYGKALMFFHMLRRELGDKTFIAASRAFLPELQIPVCRLSRISKKASRRSREATLGAEFDQWVKRTGAPEIKTGRVARDRGTRDQRRDEATLRVDLPDKAGPAGRSVYSCGFPLP